MEFPLLVTDTKDNDEALDSFLGYVSDKKMELYPAQEEAILEVFAGHNIILNTPTGSGKSLVAEALHYYALNLGKKSYYTSPIKALVNEKFISLCKTFGPEDVGMITGDASVNPQAKIICCTAEVLSNLCLREGENLDLEHAVIDEFHYYSDRDRGIAWQVPLLVLRQCRFLLMSATMGSIDFFQNELSELNYRKTVLIKSTDRPVPLFHKYSDEHLDQTVTDLLQEQKAPIYVVNFTQREAAQTAQSFLSINFCTKEEKKAIAKEIQGFKFTSPYGKEISRFLRHGVGVHHAGLLPKYRVLVESLAQKGLLKLICGTDTLGVGVNVPIRTVLFTKLCKFDGEKTGILSVRDFHQISGRAGRKGFDDKGYVVCQAPPHVIENLKIERKMKANPRKKLVKAKPPERGYVHWSKETFEKLIQSDPEPLRSRFNIDHGTLLNVLSRSNDGCAAMRELINKSHESDILKQRHRKRAFQLFRSLVERKIIEIIPVEEREGSKVRVNMNLQEDFSLHQTLALYLLDTLPLMDPFEEGYALNILSLVESIIENPTLILQKQLDKVKRETVGELKERGLDYDERMEELEKCEYPKPMKDFIYNTFNEFSEKHPWVGQENIKPKSIAREMFETYQGFADYIKEYNLERSEGLLLRHLSSVYKVMLQTVPDAMRNDEIDEMIVYFETMIKATDSSLLDEWQKLKDPNWRPSEQEEDKSDELGEDITKSEKTFNIHIRNSAFHFIRALAAKDYERALSFIQNKGQQWSEDLLDKTIAPFYEDHELIRTDLEARSHKNIVIIDSEDSNQTKKIKVTLIDPDENNDWEVNFTVDELASKYQGTAQLSLDSISPID